MADFLEEEDAKKKKAASAQVPWKTSPLVAAVTGRGLSTGLGGCEGTDADGQSQQNLQRLSGASVGEPLNLAVLMTTIANQGATGERRRMAAVPSQLRMMLCRVKPSGPLRTI